MDTLTIDPNNANAKAKAKAGVLEEYHNRRAGNISQEENMKILLNKVYKENGFKDFIRVTGRNYQMKGIDVILAYKDRILAVDEKAATSNWCRDINTFAFELYSHTNYKNIGWFSKDCESMTSHYMIVWVRAHDEKITRPISLDCLLIEKSILWDYIDTNHIIDGLNEQTILGKLNALPPEDRRTIYLKNDFAISQTLKFQAEQPINLLIPRKILTSLADLHIYKNYSMPCSVVI